MHANANVMHGVKRNLLGEANSGREQIAVSILECSVGNDPSAGTNEPPKINWLLEKLTLRGEYQLWKLFSARLCEESLWGKHFLGKCRRKRPLLGI